MLSHNQLLQADARGGAGGQAAAGAATTPTDQSANPTDQSGATTSGSVAPGAASNAASGAAGSSGANTAAQSGGGVATTLPPGGNGGASDVGVTADTITVGNVATLTGPVPGLFKGAFYGTNACFQYQNSLGGLYGRKFKVQSADDQLNQDQNRAQTAALTAKAFALVGSFSVFDGGMTQPVQQANIPDVGFALDVARGALKQNYSPQPNPGGWLTGPLIYYKAHFPDAVQAVGAIIGDVPSALATWAWEKSAMQALGYKIIYEQTYEPTQTDFTYDVFSMKSKGVKALFTPADVNSMARIASTLKQQNYKMQLPAYGGNAYDPAFITLAGADAVEGTLMNQSLAMYLGEDKASVPEVGLLLTWADRVYPGYKPDIFAGYGWASCRLFLQALEAAGPRATRAGLFGALSKIDSFDDHGMLGVAGPASKRPTTCYLLLQIHNGQWTRSPDDPATGFRCDGAFHLKS
jgi:ABC-type branched-subunit amino acid transport system substrate-binding protein